MKLHRLFIIPCLVAGQAAGALDVTSTPGGLAEAVGSQTDITTLAVKGQLDASDFEFITDKLTQLQSIDLSAASVAAYKGDALITGSTESPAAAIPPYAFAGTTATTITLPAGITEIGEGAFMATPIKEIAIPATVTSIGMGAFSRCHSLSSVTVPATVKSLGSHIFMDCDGLTTADIKAAVATLPAATFARCAALSKVSYPESVTAIDSAAFAGCAALTQITFGGNLKSIGASAFRGSGLREADLSASESLGEIGPWAFAHCAALTSAKIPDGVASVGEGAFFADAVLTRANFPLAATEIGSYTFNGASALDPSELSHPSITEIGDYALRGISQAKEFTLPAGLLSIGDYAMEGWTSLEEMSALTDVVPEAGTDVWAGVSKPTVKLYIDENLYDQFAEAPQWQEFNLVRTTGIVDNISEDATAGGITAYFSGTDLIVKAPTEIGNVRVYDSSARQWVYVEPATEQITIDTAGWGSRVYIVAVVLADGHSATIKIARR